MKDFRQLVIWQKAHQLTLEIYQFTKLFPREETYGLTAQIRGAARSIPTNLAEGCGREGDNRTRSFLRDRQRLRQRTGIPSSLGSRFEIDRPRLWAAGGTNNRNQKNADRADSKGEC